MINSNEKNEHLPEIPPFSTAFGDSLEKVIRFTTSIFRIL